MNDLISKLKSMGLITTGKGIKSPAPKKIQLTKVFNGSWIETNFGLVFSIIQRYVYGESHGKITFVKDSPSDIFTNYLNFIPFEEGQKIVFLDIETSNLSIDAGSFVFLIGLCYFTPTGLETNLLFIESPADEIALLLVLEERLSMFSTVGSYNGKSFDIPFLKNRAIFHKLPFTFTKLFHIDFLHVSRSIWKKRIINCKLSDIEKEILSVSRSNEEIPGWLVPQIYFDFLDQKDPEILKGVFYHNKIDVLSLAALYQHIKQNFSNTCRLVDQNSSDLASLGHHFHKNKRFDLSFDFYQKAFHLGLDPKQVPFLIRDYAMLNKKHNRWVEAIKYFKMAAKNEDWQSCVELAKYYEHVAKDFTRAIKWSKRGLKIIFDHKFEGDREKIRLRLNHRVERLNRKAGKNETYQS